MSVPLDRPATSDGLFLWVMHRFAEEFGEHAVLKGGMALRLIDSPRSTTDIDYVMVPYRSKNDVLDQVRSVLEEIEGARVELRAHSKMLRAELRVDEAVVQVEVNVALECPSEPMATGAMARALGQPSRVVRVMDHGHALANKLGAWNERRLPRDLYDVYFLAGPVGARVDLGALDVRLARIDSRRPELKRRRRMTREEFHAELAAARDELDEDALREGLGDLLGPEELAGLAPRMRAALDRVLAQLGAREAGEG